MTRPFGRRLLSDADIETWLHVARSVTPRTGAVLPARRTPPPEPKPAPAVPPAPAPGKGRSLPPPSYTPPISQPRPAAPPLAPFEKRYRQKVTHGRVEIEAAIDLHGLTQAQAHGALHGFLRGAQQSGARLVLVVTGKGRSRVDVGPVPGGEVGVLRRAVPLWLREPGLRPVVVGFEPAGLSHGGLGALYVRLRRAER